MKLVRLPRPTAVETVRYYERKELATAGVFGNGSAWPGLAVAGVMGVLAIAGASTVLSHARRELRAPAVHAR